MDSTFLDFILSNLRSTFSYSPFVEALVGAGAVVVPFCFRSIRDYITKKCRAIIAGASAGNNKSFHAPEEKDLSKYRSIDAILAVLQDYTSADRVSIYQFHNGEDFSIHNPIFKFTCAHEFITPGVKPDSNVVKRLIVSNYMDFIGPLASSEFMKMGVSEVEKGTKDCPEAPNKSARIIRYDINKMPPSSTRYLFTEQGVDILYAIPLYTLNGKQFGIICFQYLSEASDIFETVPYCDMYDKILRIQNIICSLQD